MSNLNESIVEAAALNWFVELGYTEKRSRTERR